MDPSTKSIFASKMFWANIVALAAAALAHFNVVLTPEQDDQITTGILLLLPVVNVMLRAVTSRPVTLTGAPAAAKLLPIVILLGLPLAGCGGAATAGGPPASGPTVSSSLAQLCPLYKAAYPTLAASQDAKMQNLMAYAATVCDPATGQVLSTFIADAGSGKWLAAIMQGLQIVGPLLPLLI